MVTVAEVVVVDHVIAVVVVVMDVKEFCFLKDHLHLLHLVQPALMELLVLSVVSALLITEIRILQERVIKMEPARLLVRLAC